MKALPLFILLLPILAFSSLLFLNTYDGTGYLFQGSDLRKFFFSSKECDFRVSSIVEKYIPPDTDINLLLAFPTSELLVLEGGTTIGTKTADIVVNDDVFKLIEESSPIVMCWDFPGVIVSATEVVLLRDLTRFELGSLISPILNELGIRYELPKKSVFKKGETVVLEPVPPNLNVEILRLDGQGSLILVNATDPSSVVLDFMVDGSPVDFHGEVLTLPPGTHVVAITATDANGLSSRKTVKVFSKDFEEVSRYVKVEIGYNVDEFVRKHVPEEVLKKPGRHVFYDIKPWGLYKFVIEATDSIYPELSYTLEGTKITVEATDVNGVEKMVFVNGEERNYLVEGLNIVTIVAVDGFGNTVMKSFVVKLGEPKLKKGSSFDLGGLILRGGFIYRAWPDRRE